MICPYSHTQHTNLTISGRMPLRHLWRVVFGPELYAVYFEPTPYAATAAEQAAQWALDWSRTVRTMCRVGSPVLLFMLYRRDFFSSSVF